MQAWIEAETKGADFGDQRLNRRYELLLDRLSDKPTLSIPAACRGLAETTAAYRFFDSDKTDAAKVNAALQKAAKGSLKGILGFSEEPLVSIDFNGNPLSSIVDAGCTKVIEGNMIKVLSWYDNECGFSQRVIDLIKMVGA